jgi:hypothetical protein
LLSKADNFEINCTTAAAFSPVDKVSRPAASSPISADFSLISVILLPAVPRAARLVLPSVDVPRALQVLLLGVVILFDYVYCTRRRAGIKPAFPTPCPQPHFTMADERQVLREERR